MTAVSFDPVDGGPCHSLAEAVVHARRPFVSDLVLARVLESTPTGADVAYYVDARAVIDRLNVLLPGRWKADYDLMGTAPSSHDGGATLVYRCRLAAAEGAYSDVGVGHDHKAARSDALKRAAVHLGIGHCLYRIGRQPMRIGERPHELHPAPDGTLALDDANLSWLRDRYDAWLLRDGIAEYGLPLDHGRAVRSVAPELFPPHLRKRFALRRRRPVRATAPQEAIPTPDGAAASVAQPGASAVTPATGAATSTPDATPAAAPGATEHVAASAPDTGIATAADAADTGRPDATAAGAAATLAAVPEPDDPGAEPADTPAAPQPTPGPVAAEANASPTTGGPSPEQWTAFARLAHAHGYAHPTLAALIRCVTGSTVQGLGAAGLSDARAFLDSAVAGRVPDADLAAQLAGLAAPAPDAPPARDRLAAWLLAREEQAAA